MKKTIVLSAAMILLSSAVFAVQEVKEGAAAANAATGQFEYTFVTPLPAGASVVWRNGGIGVGYQGETTAFFDAVAANCERSGGSDGAYQVQIYLGTAGAASTVGCAVPDTQK